MTQVAPGFIQMCREDLFRARKDTGDSCPDDDLKEQSDEL